MTKHILYLASGNSRRFGENKLLYPLDGKPIYRYGLETLSECVEKRGDCTLTVVSCYQEIRKEAKSRGIRAIDSPESTKGISYTIKAGLKALTGTESEPVETVPFQNHGNFQGIAQEDFVMFVVADQPYLSTASVERLLACAKEGVETASLVYGDRPGNPTLFSAKLIPELMSLEGDTGGRAVIRKHGCIDVQAESEVELRDIDTKEDCK